MVKIPEHIAIWVELCAAVPVAQGILNAGIVKLGHTFNLLANTGLLQAGIFGTTQACVANALWLKLNLDKDTSQWFIRLSLIGCHILTGAALFAISLLAVKAGIIATGVTLSTA